MTTVSYVAQPELRVDGTVLNAQIVAVSIEDSLDGLDRAEVELDGWTADGYDWFAGTLDFGKEVSIAVGAVDERALRFVGRVSGIDGRFRNGGGTTVTFLLEDAMSLLRSTRRTRSFDDVSDKDLVQRLAKDHGLRAEVDLDGPTHLHVAQLNLSDLAFLRDRVRGMGGELWLDGPPVHARQSRPTDDPVELDYGYGLRSFRVVADLADQCSEQHVTGWDVAAKEAIDESADASDLCLETDHGRTAATVLDDTFGRRIETAVLTSPVSIPEARSRARGLYAERSRRFVVGSGLADGLPRLRAGRSVRLGGLGPIFDGVYHLVATRHLFTVGEGYRTEFDAERPGVGAA